MRPAASSLVVALALVAVSGCSETGALDGEDVVVPLSLQIDTPTYGAFLGTDVARIAGRVTPITASVTVEGVVVPVKVDGSFLVDVPVRRPYKILDIAATDGTEVMSERFPVFRGRDPLESWPGALTARLTPDGLIALETVLEGTVTDLLDQAVPAGTVFPVGNGIELELVGITLGAFDVTLDPTAEGLEATFGVDDAVIEVVVHGSIGGFPLDVPGALTFPEAALAARLDLSISDQGEVMVGLTEPDVAFEVPTVELFGANLDFLSDLIAQNLDLETLLSDQLDGLLGGLDGVPVFGPIDFETDLLGTSIAVSLTDLTTDDKGVGLGLGIGLGGPVPPSAKDVPLPGDDFSGRTDLALAVHDGLLQLLLDSDLLDLLDTDLQLPGFLGVFFDPLIEGLPGGGQVPEHDGWCVSIDPGDAKVARFGVGDDPLAGIYMPVAGVTFSTLPPGGGACEPWLVTSLALEVALDVSQGTKLSIDLSVPEGIVVSYGAVGADEDEIVPRIGGLLESLLSLLGGFTEIDLADLLGGGAGGVAGLPLDGLSLEIQDSKRLIGADGAPVEDMVEIGVSLFGDPAAN
ncbi:MAG: hypothetical protein H6733_17465 [Alphaproteobacteria bacterium]|nr:hypothetical protein [Alphaproteobacteria bacterium]